MKMRAFVALSVAWIVVYAFALMLAVVWCGTPEPTPYTVSIGR